jgi:UDP-2-acetamido-3-amino-2,3-dideoxy-glucuronate N-acetyltransferase
MSVIAAVTLTKARYYVHPNALVESSEIGPGTKIWAFAHVMDGARVGANCKIGDHAFIESGAVLGNYVTVKNGVAIWDRVTVEDNVFLGPNCVLTNDLNPRTYIQKGGDSLTPTLIRANATIGANATIVCGITIGQYAFIGAGAVVIRSVPDFALVVGNPSRQIGWMCACANKLPLPASAPPGMGVTCRHCRMSLVVTVEGLSVRYEDLSAEGELR